MMHNRVETIDLGHVLSFEDLQMTCAYWWQRFLPIFFARKDGIRLIIPGRIDLRPGITLLVGESGSGKSVFLSLLAGYPLANAQVFVRNFCVGGQSVKYLISRKLAASTFIHGMHRAFRSVPRFFLPQKFPEVAQSGVRVWEVLLLIVDGLLGAESLTKPRVEKINCLKKLLERAGLEDKWQSEFSQLSGGERQRMELLARFAVVKLSNAEQMILLLDEPTTGLDVKNAQTFYVLLSTLLDEVKHASAVIATHDLLTCPNSIHLPLLTVVKQHSEEIQITQHESALHFIQAQESDAKKTWEHVYERLQECTK